jgi:CHAT domain-containing protein/tetratricopeptide (TPR) repeat protein
MKPFPGKLIICMFAFCFALPYTVLAQPDTVALPASVQQQLQNFRQKDQLDEWIYSRIAFVDEKSADRIVFLMHTQKEAWRSYKTYKERLAWFDLLSLQGYYQLQSGNILSSISAYEAALEFYESYPLPDADIIEYVLKPLGNNYTRLADYRTALFIHEKTLALALKRKDANTIASVYSNMAICARWKGDLSSATEYCRKGIATVDRKNALYGLLLSVYADVLTEQNKYDTAAVVCRQSLRQLRQNKNDASVVYWYIGALQTAARIALQQQQHSAAVNDATTALKLLQQHFPTSRWREKAKVHVLLGEIYLAANYGAHSLQHYQQALVLLLPQWKPTEISALPPENFLYSENTIGDALAGKAAALQTLHQPNKALQHYIAAFMAERKLRKAFYAVESKIKEAELVRSRAEAAMQLAYELWHTTHSKKYLDQVLMIAELSKAQVLMDERNMRSEKTSGFSSSDSLLKRARQLQQAINYYQHELVNAADKKQMNALLQGTEYELALLRKKIKQHTAYAAAGETMLTVEELYGFCKQLPPNVTVLEFFEGKNRSYMIEVNASGIQAVRLITEAKQLRTAVKQFMQRWFAHGPSAMINEPKIFYQSCYDLYAGIFAGYKWKKDERYILIPDGIFNYLPFDALVTESNYQGDFSNWPWLFRKTVLSQAYSLQSWHVQQTASYPLGAFTAFFVSKGKEQVQPALAVEQEYNLLRDKINGSYYLNNSATWSAFNHAAEQANVLHIGTHAVSSANDSFPYLQLYDRRFYLFDLQYKKFTPALIVLGACKTADGQLLEGEGVNSLSRGFVAAGAGGIVSGLWNVNDETAIAFTESFYKYLQQDKDAAMALHDAKQEWLLSHKDQPVLQLPYYWAGFVYNGHLQKLSLEEKQNYWMYYAGGLLLVLTGVVYIIAKKAEAKNLGNSML